ncbi:MAG TPA: lytic murein transglycosylase B [Cellvibrionales bacterium]|nr:lytic murein transglycosylase B [Cellvibrionales bacterium]
MRMVVKCFNFYLAQLVLFAALSLSSLASADYSEHPSAQALIDTLVSEHDFTVEQVKAVLVEADTQQRILDSMTNAAEKTKTWTAYRRSFLSPIRITQGVKFLAKHEQIFDQVEQQYGVPREIITAIVGVETNYGGYTGKASVLDALATLAFEHPRRSRFFTSELVEFIVLCREQQWSPEQQLGSYAGAMGMSQFMPSNYRRLAVDGNGDGQVDLFEPVDAIHSIANYFVHHGWETEGRVTSRAAVSAEFDTSVIGKSIKPNRSVEDLALAGYHPQDQVPAERQARVIRFNDADGDEFWLGYQNFYVISRYNPRSKYAMAVYQLSQSILSAAKDAG